MSWVNEYTGIPFKKSGIGFDGTFCWGLVVLVYCYRRGIILPDYDGCLGQGSDADLRRVLGIIETESGKWFKVKQPKELDVVLFRTGILNRHIGIALDHYRMLHVDKGIKSCVQRFNSLAWKYKLIGFYRYDEKR